MLELGHAVGEGFRQRAAAGEAGLKVIAADNPEVLRRDWSGERLHGVEQRPSLIACIELGEREPPSAYRL